MRHRIFLLSPGSLTGKRAALLLDDSSDVPLARTFRSRAGVSLGELFAFISPLYFRGKRAYARKFASPPPRMAGTFVITADRGLVPTEAPVRPEDLRAMAQRTIDPQEPSYVEPLVESARELRERVGSLEPVLLGSIATDKYVGPLAPVFGRSLRFPAAFVGRGGLSRGSLLLRRVNEGRELDYVVAQGTERAGPRSTTASNGRDRMQ